ncbi:MAG: hypothetical protein PHS44_08255 [Candidatus Dojkabacteria bacterium]|jgi:hypothetical protein|nr:hypothetical protein [Candidatus Dojkabacteria bacterium]
METLNLSNQKNIIREGHKSIRRVDQFIFNRSESRRALEAAQEKGEIVMFSLDCTVATPEATQSGIGKFPSIDPVQIRDTFGPFYQYDTLAYIGEVLSDPTGIGADVHFVVFLHDEDYLYSVSPEFSFQSTATYQALQIQHQIIAGELESQMQGHFSSLSVQSWASIELSHPEIGNSRLKIVETLQTLYLQGALPLHISKQLEAFIFWRKELLAGLAVDFPDSGSVIFDQAVQELASIVLQGYYAPVVIQGLYPDVPIIMVNTFPDLRAQFLDDHSLSFGQVCLGADLPIPYGIVHAPGPERFEKFMKQEAKVKKGKVLTCGDPTGNPNYL